MMTGETFPQISGPGWRRVTTKRRLERQLVNSVDMEEVDMVGKEQVESLFSLGRAKLIKFYRYNIPTIYFHNIILTVVYYTS